MYRLLTLLAAIAALQTGDQTRLMDRIETIAKLPDRAAPTASYARYYAWLGDKTVIAIYVRPGIAGAPAGRQWVKPQDLPRISDGGCAIVTLFYDPAKDEMTGAMCNASI